MASRSLVRRAALLAGAGLLTLTLAPAATASGTHQVRVPVNVWASDVNVHTDPYTTAPVTGQVGPGTVDAVCQAPGGSVSYGQYYNYWWTLVDGGWISDVFISGGANDEPVPGIPFC